MNPRMILAVAVIFAGGVFADDTSARAKLDGAWQPQDPAQSDAGLWILQTKGDTLQVTHSLGDKKLIEFECPTTGSECQVKDSGKNAKVSMWFNGPKLVELETEGKDVVKRRFAVAESGDSLELEVIPIQPDGKTETLRFRRVHQ